MAAPAGAILKSTPKGSSANPPPQGADVSVGSDIAASIRGGLRRGTEFLAGAPGDVNNWTNSLIQQVAESLMGKENAAALGKYVPEGLKSEGYTTGDVQAATREYLGGDAYKPQTKPGEYVSAVGEQLPGMLVPGGAPKALLGKVVEAI